MVVGIAWTAGAVRGRALARRRLGPQQCAALAGRGSLDEVLSVLRSGPYGHELDHHMSLGEAQWAIEAAPLWHLRVLAGWVPATGAELLRALASWWEVLNIEGLLAGLAGANRPTPHDLGQLDTAWKRVQDASSREEVRRGLATSPWLDPGSDAPAAIVTWLQLSWADRIAAEAYQAGRLAGGWAALAAARELASDERTSRGATTHRVRSLGRGWREAADVAGLVARLPGSAAWVLEGVTDPSELWRAELRWWRRLEAQGNEWLRHPGSGPEMVLGVFSVLLADAHRVQGVVELAARGGAEQEVIDELL